jgi:hypothetical protein
MYGLRVQFHLASSRMGGFCPSLGGWF